jgi:hypothetical protein
VAHDRIDPSDQIPDADLLEQQAPLDPPLSDAEHMLGRSRSTPGTRR